MNHIPNFIKIHIVDTTCEEKEEIRQLWKNINTNLENIFSQTAVIVTFANKSV